MTFAGSAAADATDDYPFPHRMTITTCTAEQILPAAKDFRRPIYYQRYIIDTHNKLPEVQQAAIDNARYFDALSRTAISAARGDRRLEPSGESGLVSSV